MKKERCRCISSTIVAVAVMAGILVCAGAAPALAQVVAFVASEDLPMPFSVEVSSTATTTGRVTSAQTGCLDYTVPCPKAKKVKINCPRTPGAGDVCTAFFPGGSKVTLKANPGDSVFAGWDYMIFPYGENYSYGLDKSITVRVPGSATAFFVPHGTTYSLTLEVSSYGGGSIAGATIVSNPPGILCHGDGTGTCSYPFDAGTYVTLTAQNKAGTQLMGWDMMFPYFLKLCDKPGPCKVPMSYVLWHP